MKLRIHGSSLRLRVSRSDLENLKTAGYVEDALRFSANSALIYRLELAERADVKARFTESLIVVELPNSLAAPWYAEDQVSISAQQGAAPDPLDILIEKDFTCLVPRPGEDQADFFPNPAKS